MGHSSDSDGCFALMHTLVQYRHQPIHGQLSKIAHRYSMLHLDVLLLVYHFAKISAGAVLEIGAFLGGATMAAVLGARASGGNKTITTIEPGGRVAHEKLSSRNILRDLERNLAKQRMLDLITLVKGHSFDPGTHAAVQRALGRNEIELLILDADGAVRRDLKCYAGMLRDGCWMIIDDYFGPAANTKVRSTRAEVDALVEKGALVPLGFYGWGTWVGQWRPVPGAL